MSQFRKSVNKRNHGPTVEWLGGTCPVPPGTPISFLRRGNPDSWQHYWQAVRKPELLNWQHTGGHKDIVAYYERIPPPPPPVFGAAQSAAPTDSAALERAVPSLAQYQRWTMAISQALGVAQALLSYKKSPDWLEIERRLSQSLEEMRPFSVGALLASVIETQSATTAGRGPQDESATGEAGDAPEQSV